MSAESAALLKLAESIADGSPIDWNAEETRANAEEQALLHQLRVIAELAGVHRSLPADPGDLPSRYERRQAPTMPAIGTWGHLALLERIGGGSSGDVYRAWDRLLEREIALKLLRQDLWPGEPVMSRITLEARLLARLRHPNIITVYGVGTNDSRVGLWMELVRGATLEKTLHDRGPFSAREAALVGIDLCRALAAIHAAGLIHRDVKAQNVMREEGGRIVLMDFGTGRETGRMDELLRADTAGTPLYQAPEILNGSSASARTDIYSLGVLLYRLVTGEYPVRAGTPEELRLAHAEKKRVLLRDARPNLPTAFVRVVDRAIASEPERRYDSAGALEEDLLRALDDASAARTAGARDSRDPASRTFSWRAAVVAAALVAVVAGLVAPLVWWRGGRSAEAGAAGPIRSIAVLPLANLSGDPSQEYFADGMTEEFIAMLGRLSGLSVISRTSVMKFKGSARSLPEIAKALGVDTVLEGSVQMVPDVRSGSSEGMKRVRINARLIAAGTDTQLWNRTFETVVNDVMTLQSQVAKAVAEGIHLRLSAQQQSRLAKSSRPNGQPQDFEAFDLFLRGRYYWNLRTPEDIKRSIDYFQKAIERDPRFAAPHAGLADAFILLGDLGAMPYVESITRARAAATTAIALDDSLADAHASLGVVQDTELDWDAAAASFRRAIELKPGFARAHHWYSALLAQRGSFPEALSEIEKALDLDPLSVSIHTQRAAILFLSRQYDETILQAQKALELEPKFVRAHVFLVEAYGQKGDYDRAFAAAEAAAALGGRTAELGAFVGCFLAKSGRTAEAHDTAQDLVTRYRAAQEGGPFGVAVVYACLNDKDRAFEWLYRAQQLRDPWIAYLKVSPWFDNLQSDPRFNALVASLGLTR